MPLNGSGTYNLPNPPVFPAVAGTTIKASDFNAIMADMASAITEMIARDGQSIITGVLQWGQPAANLAALGGVALTGAQTIAGVKTFSSPPVVPNGAASGEAVNKGQLDSVVTGLAASGGSASQTFSVAPATAVEHAVRFGQFLAAVAGSGLSLEFPCAGLPSGATRLIVKIGKVASAADNSYTTVTLPEAFPNQCFAVYSTVLRGAALSGDGVLSSFAFVVDKTQIAVGVCTNVAISAPDVQWIAIGW